MKYYDDMTAYELYPLLATAIAMENMATISATFMTKFIKSVQVQEDSSPTYALR